MLIYAGMLTGPQLVRSAILTCRDLGFQTVELEHPATIHDNFVAIFASKARFPKRNIMCWSQNRLAEHKIAIPDFAKNAKFVIAINDAYAASLKEPAFKLRFADALRQINRQFMKQYNKNLGFVPRRNQVFKAKNAVVSNAA